MRLQDMNILEFNWELVCNPNFKSCDQIKINKLVSIYDYLSIIEILVSVNDYIICQDFPIPDNIIIILECIFNSR